MKESDEIKDLVQKLTEWFDSEKKYVVAFSGGVDSVTLTRSALASGVSVSGLFVYGSDSPAEDLEQIDNIAREVGIDLIKIEGEEQGCADFLRNDSMRCYYCKKYRYEKMKKLSQGKILLDGSNADDLQDYRPGTKAIRELGIRSPLAELGIEKKQVRALARYWNLSVADKPSNPCLVTRLAYGLAITEDRLRMVDKAESFLHENGFLVCRVRMDAPYTARIEVAKDQLSAMLAEPFRARCIYYFHALGFHFISLDLEGFLSGKMNRSL